MNIRHDPEKLGLEILRVKQQQNVSICEAADRVFADMATPRGWPLSEGQKPATHRPHEPRESV